MLALLWQNLVRVKSQYLLRLMKKITSEYIISALFIKTQKGEVTLRLQWVVPVTKADTILVQQ